MNSGWEKKYRRPVVKLRLALYGHPLAGRCWEQKWTHEVRKVGFEPVPDWESMYFHLRLRLMLSVFVDDFTLAGPRSALVAGWKLLRTNLDIDTPTPLGTYLGCGHKSIDVETSEVLARTLLSKHGLRVEQVQKDSGNGGNSVGVGNKKSKSLPQSLARGV